MIIRNGTKSLSLTIDGYQYPYQKSSGKNYDYDANWLDVKIVYTDESGDHQYIDACLLTGELTELTEDIAEVFSGNESLYISDFMEPYLKTTAIRVEELVMLGIEYVYDTSDGIWKSHKITELISSDRAGQIIDELRSMSKKYPKR